MQSRFGQDFSAVRVHDDPSAARSAIAVDALAYTVGRDVVFAPGWDGGRSAAGRRLLAHELTHVLQAGAGYGSGLHRQPAPPASDCKGWESDRESLVTAVARHYARFALHPPVDEPVREIRFSRDGLIATAYFPGGLELFVSLHLLPDYIPVVTHGGSNVRGPRCEFEYSCPPDGSIVFVTRICEPRSGTRPQP